MKVGDRVRVIDDILGNAPQYVRQVGILVGIDNDGSFDYVVRHADGTEQCWDLTELEARDDDDICEPQESGCGGMCSGCE